MLLSIFCMNTLKNERGILIGENSQKLLSTLCNLKNIFFLCVYKMYLISAEGYKNANVDILTKKSTSEIWVSMKDVRRSMGVKSISDLVLKKMHGICETKYQQKNKLMNIK